MEFALTSDQQAIVEAATSFAAEKIAPGYAERDKSGVFSKELTAEMGALGFIAPEQPESYGGSEVSYLTSGMVMEALSAADFNMGYVQLLGSLNTQILARYATPELAQKWIPKICAGKCILGVALTEPGGGSDAANLQLRAEKVEGGYRLSGEKASISMADQADIMIVFARTGEKHARAKGVSAFLVEMNTEGVSTGRYEDMGQRCIGRGSIFFDQAFIPEDHRLGEENRAFSQVMEGFDFSRALIGLQCLAVAEQSLKESWQYASEREAFGEKIAEFQGVTFPLAEAETFLEAAKLLCYKTLWLKDQGLPHTTEAAMCKWWPPKLGFEIIHQCLLTHGHGGYGRDYPFEQRLRDVLGLQIGDGTANIMKMIIARQKLGEVT
ncbi:cyclohexanecarboxyl-CoA dehydrogenase [Sneathiella sp. P13V-1]|uniref:acyl-CoA dehydrogenase family protein n=1 Tax=Sneathiella sp. P13V-1 TaxID=2697366 RepID=UPI00187B3B8D|nr:acyl-CoA dehydrogenase family protein [Sneathiella sp. P13V-1]MBE7636533.1 cyclohexanecarboxyl-CoA dehydrogenase [Sneathiella sp. P13V-1]